MTYVLVLMMMLQSGEIRRAEAPMASLETCLSSAKEFLSQDLDDLLAQRIGASCTVISSGVKS